MEKNWLGIAASPQKQSLAFVVLNASSLPNEGSQLGLFDWSETGLSDTVANITETQIVQKVESRPCTVNRCQIQKPWEKLQLKTWFDYTENHSETWAKLKVGVTLRRSEQ